MAGMTVIRGDRGRHPDLDQEGNLKVDALFDHSGNPAERDLNRTLNDPASAQHFLGQVAREQSELPVPVQQYVGGRQFGNTPAEGYRQYAQERAWALQVWGRGQGFERVITDAQVADMSLAEYDRHFDERGEPRDGTLFWRTSRSQRLDDGMDAASQSEMRNIPGTRR